MVEKSDVKYLNPMYYVGKAKDSVTETGEALLELPGQMLGFFKGMFQDFLDLIVQIPISIMQGLTSAIMGFLPFILLGIALVIGIILLVKKLFFKQAMDKVKEISDAYRNQMISPKDLLGVVKDNPELAKAGAGAAMGIPPGLI